MKTYTSENLRLRPISLSDLDFMRHYLSDPERTRYLPLEKPYPEEKAVEWVTQRLKHWQRRGFGTFILEEKATGDKIGFCGLEYVRDTDFVDIRYGLLQEAWGRGYAFEAAMFCLELGFHTLKFEVLYGAAVRENQASIHILRKLGMQPDSDFDAYGDVVEPFSISKGEYGQRGGA